MANQEGDLKIWWVPQVPMNPFEVPVKNIEEAMLLLDTLAAYDQFQLDNNVKPDYCNAGGLSRYEPDGNGGMDWSEWEDDNGNSIDDLMRERHEAQG